MNTDWISRLTTWFDQNQRRMPWRSYPIPYWVWVSEAMLQQTQVATVIPYFQRFVSLFPDIAALARADQQAVLKAWEGLGYYSRARNLHKAAQIIDSELNGVVPDDYGRLQELPGFGPYIAAAVVSIAYGKPVPVVDGNVLRVFSRFWAISDDIRSPKVRDALFGRLTPYIQGADPSTFNQAIMELGALVCTPKSPACTDCPLAQDCEAYTQNRIDEFPVKSKKDPVPHYTIGVGVVWKDNQVLIGRRAEDQLLGGLWEFPGGKQLPEEAIEQTVVRELLEETGVRVRVGQCYAVVNHAYTHFKITLHAYECFYESGDPQPKSATELRWVGLDEIDAYPFPKANLRVLEAMRENVRPLSSQLALF
ncbi:A/G-specific adenine glycosylase [bacterium]|nr:A/G-specific adenine glycosylase [bacterium]